MFMTNDLEQEVQLLFQSIRSQLALSQCYPKRLKYYILEHSGFSRNNPMLLATSANNSQSVPALSAELRRNYEEEIGSPSEASHFAVYNQGLLESFGFSADEYVVSSATNRFLKKLLNLVESGTASSICGVFYATEASAIPELELIRDITDLYSKRQDRCQKTKTLSNFFDLHLNGVEQGHKDGLGFFINQYDEYNLNLSQIRAGFFGAMEAMKTWWTSLEAASSEQDLISLK